MNSELEQLETGLAEAVRVLPAPAGRVGVITFHSSRTGSSRVLPLEEPWTVRALRNGFTICQCEGESGSPPRYGQARDRLRRGGVAQSSQPQREAA